MLLLSSRFDPPRRGLNKKLFIRETWKCGGFLSRRHAGKTYGLNRVPPEEER
jgi:hypothetical protein